MKPKHAFFYRFFRPLVIAFLWLTLGYRFEKPRNLPENYIVLANHNMDFDPVLVGAAFPRPMYFVASEHIARWGWISKFLMFCFSPLFRYKGSSAASVVLEMLRILRDGGNVCMFAEGVRSWDGTPSPIQPATGKMVKKAKCGLVTYRLEGGYFVTPFWGQSGIRRGRLRGRPVGVYTAQQLEEMTVEQVNALIVQDLHEDAYDRQLADPVPYRGKNLAERMENLLFLCPQCGETETIGSKGDRVFCRSCGMEFRYTEYGMLEGGPFTTVRELSQWQKSQVRRHAEEGRVYTVTSAKLSTVTRHREELLYEGPVTLGPAGLVCGERRFRPEEILDLAMHGRSAVVFSTKDGYYELIPAEGCNGLKLHLLYQAMKEKR